MGKNSSLDPDDWGAFRETALKMLNAALDKMESATDGPVWRQPDEGLRSMLAQNLPTQGAGMAGTQAMIESLLPFGVGNTHPRFFGWVHGAGSASGLISEMAAAAMNANLGGRDHGAMLVEKQVVAWVRQMFDFPPDSSGLVVSGTSMATIVALKAARDQAISCARTNGIGVSRLVGYASDQAHNCVARAFDMLGLGTEALRAVPVNAAYEMDLDVLQGMMADDRAAGLEPFLLVGTAGSVNVGAFDDLAGLADLAKQQDMWLHIDGAFGAAGILSDTLKHRLNGVERADSIAFDFHKWLHVNYDAGFVLMRDEAAHRGAFSTRPDYLQGADAGLAAGQPWPVEYGPELSRGFRALKIWAQINALGTDALGQAIDRNCAQAQYLAGLVDAHPKLERMAPVASSIVVFRHIGSDALNQNIMIRLHESGLAAPSITTLNGQSAIRVNITNHRTKRSDLDMLIDGIVS